MKIRIAALALLAGLAGGGPIATATAGNSFLAHLVGTWIGRGTTQTSLTAKPERVYCKLTNTLSPDGNSLIQKGRCAITSNSGALGGTITAMGDSTYSGELDSFASRGPAAISGALSDGQLVMHSKYIAKLSGDPVEATNTLALTADGYTLTATRVDPASGSAFTSSRIAFTAK